MQPSWVSLIRSALPVFQERNEDKPAYPDHHFQHRRTWGSSGPGTSGFSPSSDGHHFKRLPVSQNEVLTFPREPGSRSLSVPPADSSLYHTMALESSVHPVEPTEKPEDPQGLSGNATLRRDVMSLHGVLRSLVSAHILIRRPVVTLPHLL